MWEYIRYFAICEGLLLLYLLVTYLPPNIKFGILFVFTIIELVFMGFKSNTVEPPPIDKPYLWFGTPLSLLIFTVALLVIYVRRRPV